MTASMAGHAPVHRPHGPSGSRSAQRWPAPALHPAMPPRIVEAFELKAAAVRHDASLPAWLARIGLAGRDRCRIVDGAVWLAGHWYVGGRCWWRLKASQTSHASRSQCAQRTSPSASFPLALYLIQRAAHVPAYRHPVMGERIGIVREAAHDPVISTRPGRPEIEHGCSTVEEGAHRLRHGHPYRHGIHAVESVA